MLFAAFLNLSAAMMGCHAIDFYTPSLQKPVPPEMEPPRELNKVSLPTYRIEPPDILQIDVVKLVPRPSYRIDCFDTLNINVVGTMRDQPINGIYEVNGDGMVLLGPAYGMVRVRGLTIEQASEAVRQTLQFFLQNPGIAVFLVRSYGIAQIDGQYIVRPDGTISLRQYGMVNVAGKTVTEARLAIQEHLAQYFDSPMVGVDVLGYNSAAYFVVIASEQSGEIILRYPITGNETVLDALGQFVQLPKVSSNTMWLARPAPAGFGAEQIFPIDWNAMTRGGQPGTNYQLMPGDRLYIVDDTLIAADNFVSRMTAPLERLLYITRLGTGSQHDAQVLGRSYNSSRLQ